MADKHTTEVCYLDISTLTRTRDDGILDKRTIVEFKTERFTLGTIESDDKRTRWHLEPFDA